MIQTEQHTFFLFIKTLQDGNILHDGYFLPFLTRKESSYQTENIYAVSKVVYRLRYAIPYPCKEQTI